MLDRLLDMLTTQSTEMLDQYIPRLEQGRIDADAFDGLKQENKDEMPDWLENLRQYDDVDWPE